MVPVERSPRMTELDQGRKRSRRIVKHETEEEVKKWKTRKRKKARFANGDGLEEASES